MSHTPGPWKVMPLEGKHYGTEIELSNGAGIEVWGTHGDGGGSVSQDPENGAYPSKRYGRPEPGSPDWAEWFCDEHWESTEDLANARLIAAAPIMWEYLKVLADGGDNKAHAILKEISGP